MYAIFIPAIVIAYILGSIPFGLIIAKAHGKDLRAIGSGNIGATNVSRAIGKRWAYVCFALDVSKGFIPTVGTMLVAKYMSPQVGQTGVLSLWLWLAVGCAAIAGHIFPIYVGFKGGKGVATSLGVAIGLWPYFTLCTLPALIVWAAVFFKWRYVSLASISAAAAFPIAFIILTASLESWTVARLWPLAIAATAIPVTVVILHSDNIKRLLSGTEHRTSMK